MIGYLDTFSGISGDMLLGALVHAGVDCDRLRERLALLDLDGWNLDCEKVETGGIAAFRVRVDPGDNRSLRHLGDLVALLDRSGLDETVRSRSQAVFQRLAAAEARVHGTTVEQVHFHEVGAVDAVLDIVGTVIGLQMLDIDRLCCSPLPMPTGWVRAAHGDLPLPAPAVVELARGLPCHGVDLAQEMVTPTGAALVAELCDGFGTMPPMTIDRVGYGAGSMVRLDKRPNLLRLVTGEPLDVQESQMVTVLETALDDWTPEGFPYVAERLFAAGALDVHLAPIQMKKGRPGFLLRVIAPPENDLELKKIILSETTAIGLRFHSEQRMTLARQQVVVPTRWGDVDAKKVRTPAGTVVYPEYDSCRRTAQAADVPLAHVYREVSSVGNKTSSSGKGDD